MAGLETDEVVRFSVTRSDPLGLEMVGRQGKLASDSVFPGHWDFAEESLTKYCQRLGIPTLC